EDVEVGDTIGKIDENAEAGSASSETEEQPKEEKEEPADKKEEPKKEEPKKEEPKEGKSTSDADDVSASPAARKPARDLNIDFNDGAARDTLDSVRPEDVDAAAKEKSSKDS